MEDSEQGSVLTFDFAEEPPFPRLSNPLGKAAFLSPPSSRLAVFALEIYDGVSGKFLAFPGIGKEAMHVMATRGRQLSFDAPDFLKHQIASAFDHRFF